MCGIYSFGLIVPVWHLLIWTYCTLVAFIHLDLLCMGGIYYILTYFTWVSFIHLDLFYMGYIYSFGLMVHGWHLFVLTY